MAQLLSDGFDVYNGVGTNTGLQASWTLSSTTNISMVSGRFGGQAVQYRFGSSSAYAARTFTASASIGIGYALRMATMPGASPTDPEYMHVNLMSGATYMIGIKITAAGEIQVYRMSGTFGGTSLGTSSVCIFSATWHYIEVGISIHDTTGTVTVKCDGSTVLTLTGQDTRNGAPTTVDTIRLGDLYGLAFTDGGIYQVDDLYIIDSATTLGEAKIETTYPSSDIAQGWTRSAGSDNYALVDEAQVDGDTTYVQGSAVSDVDTYEFGNLSGTPSTIHSVKVIAFGRKTDAGTREIALQVKSGATTSDGANYPIAASYGKMERLLEVDPDTGVPWTASGVTALRAGPKVTV